MKIIWVMRSMVKLPGPIGPDPMPAIITLSGANEFCMKNCHHR